MSRGCVDVVSHRGISGWAAASEGDSEAKRFVTIVIDGKEIGSVIADQFRSDLLEAAVSDGFSGFTYLFPVAPDPFFTHLIEVRDRDSGAALMPFPAVLKSLAELAKDSMLEFDQDVVTAHLRDARFHNSSWVVDVDLIGKPELEFRPVITNGSIVVCEEIDQVSPIFDGVVRKSRRVIVTGDPSAEALFLRPLVSVDEARKYAPVCEIALPCRMPHYAKELTLEHMIRVSGPGVSLQSFAATGVNTAYRINSILQTNFGKSLPSFGKTLDWGVGPGRVALPIKNLIAPEIDLVGTDVDEFNINFGLKHHRNIQFIESPFYPPLPFSDGYFDLAYGVSVMTHLTEGAQFVWLKELRRILQPGAPLILTVHGEFAILNTVRSRQTNILEAAINRGFSDDLLDMNLGPKLSQKSYYRSTFHTRKYVAEEWTEYFDIVAHYSCANVLVQDFVVLRAR